MDLKNKIYCIIPAYNEAKLIGGVIESLKPYVGTIVVINDGSKDNTANEALRHGAVVLTHLINRGQGAALETGDRYALSGEAEVIIHFDADGQFIPEEIPQIIKPVIEGRADVVLGSRFLTKRPQMPAFKRHIIFPVARLVNRVLLGVRYSDPQSGFRAFSRQALAQISISNDGSAHCSEILHQISRFHLKVIEVPITVIYHEFGQTISGGKGRGTGGWAIVKDLLLSKLIN